MSQQMDGLLSTRWFLGHRLSVHKGSRGRSHSLILDSSFPLRSRAAHQQVLSVSCPEPLPDPAVFPGASSPSSPISYPQLGFTAHISGFPASYYFFFPQPVFCTVATMIFQNSEIGSCQSPGQRPFPGLQVKPKRPTMACRAQPLHCLHCLAPSCGSSCITNLPSSCAPHGLCTRCGLCAEHSDWFSWLILS